MGITKRWWPAALVLSAGLAVAAPIDAQVWDRNGWGPRWNEGRTYANNEGYREGIEQGVKDVRSRRTFNYTDDRTYRHGDRGYKREFGDRDLYRRAFREAYVAGYREGYYGRGAYNGYPDSRRRAIPRAGSIPGPTYPDRYPYPNGYPGGYPSSGRYPGSGLGIARDHGFNDGYDKGLEDGRDRDRFDPTRHGWYRSGSRGFRGQSRIEGRLSERVSWGVSRRLRTWLSGSAGIPCRQRPPLAVTRTRLAHRPARR